MTIDTPDKLVDHAKAHGLSVEAYLRDNFADDPRECTTPGFVRIGGRGATPEARVLAAQSLREIASRNTLGGLTIEELIDEGRKY